MIMASENDDTSVKATEDIGDCDRATSVLHGCSGVGSVNSNTLDLSLSLSSDTAATAIDSGTGNIPTMISPASSSASGEGENRGVCTQVQAAVVSTSDSQVSGVDNKIGAIHQSESENCEVKVHVNKEGERSPDVVEPTVVKEVDLDSSTSQSDLDLHLQNVCQVQDKDNSSVVSSQPQIMDNAGDTDRSAHIHSQSQNIPQSISGSGSEHYIDEYQPPLFHQADSYTRDEPPLKRQKFSLQADDKVLVQPVLSENIQCTTHRESIVQHAPEDSPLTSAVDELVTESSQCVSAESSVNRVSGETENLNQAPFEENRNYQYLLSLEHVPQIVCEARREFVQAHEENFLRGCKWSPDGSCVLANSNDNCLRVFTVASANVEESVDNEWRSVMRMKERGTIYDFTLHPLIFDNERGSCLVASTCSGIPIHLWDWSSGEIVANYKAYNQYDEVTPAYSLSFTLDGRKLFGGYKKAIRIFDSEYPGRACKMINTFDSRRKEGQTGIISCISHSPDGSNVFVAGSYSRHVGIYDATCHRLVCLMQGQHGGVTHLQFSPDGSRLYCGGRKDAEILCWDMRNTGRVLYSYLRDVQTNQRMYFDLSPMGQHLVTGNHDGTVSFWDSSESGKEIGGDNLVQPCCMFQAHRDCVNGVSFSPKGNFLATASGQRHFPDFENFDSDDSSSEGDCTPFTNKEFCLKLWKLPIK